MRSQLFASITSFIGYVSCHDQARVLRYLQAEVACFTLVWAKLQLKNNICPTVSREYIFFCCKQWTFRSVADYFSVHKCGRINDPFHKYVRNHKNLESIEWISHGYCVFSRYDGGYSEKIFWTPFDLTDLLLETDFEMISEWLTKIFSLNFM